jgi:hypothetical protein
MLALSDLQCLIAIFSPLDVLTELVTKVLYAPILQSGAEYVCIFDESALTTQCRRDLINVRAKMEQAGLHPTEALCDALQLMLIEFDILFPPPTFHANHPGSFKKCVFLRIAGNRCWHIQSGLLCGND